MRTPRSIGVWIALAACVAACGDSGSGAPPGPGAAASTSTTADPDWPPQKTSHKTTSGEIATGNLDGQIESLEKMLATAESKGASPADPTIASRRRQLVDLLSTRAEFEGRIADLQAAADLAERLVADTKDASSLLTRAGARAGLHRFDDARADLDEAEKLGAPKAATAAARASLLLARGDLEQALSLQREAVSARRDIQSTLVLAVILGQLDRREEALSAFREALSSYRDTSPFPVARLFFHEAQFWEREGRKDLAIAYGKAAVERVPSYAHAAAHLGRLAKPAEAIPMLRALAARSDDPEIACVLADRLRESGERAEGDALAVKAGARYDDLVARHPEAFADHAAQFWLDTGNDANKALALAKVNLAARRTPKAFELVVLSALSAGDRKTACEIGSEGAKLPGATSMFREIVRGACEPR